MFLTSVPDTKLFWGLFCELRFLLVSNYCEDATWDQAGNMDPCPSWLSHASPSDFENVSFNFSLFPHVHRRTVPTKVLSPWPNETMQVEEILVTPRKYYRILNYKLKVGVMGLMRKAQMYSEQKGTNLADLPTLDLGSSEKWKDKNYPIRLMRVRNNM